jgi:tetratricopeptide (TPR) repeat protein
MPKKNRQVKAVEAIKMLSAYLNASEAADSGLQTNKMLVSHLGVALEDDAEFLDKTNGLDTPGLKFAAYSFAKFYQSQGYYQEAEKVFSKAVTGWESEFGVKHLDTLRMVGNHATIQNIQRNFEEAEKLYFRVLQGTRSQLGTDHPDTVQTLHNLAIVFYSQRRMDDAERFCTEALDIKGNILGSNDPSTLRSVDTLAQIHDVQGRKEDAERLYKRVLILGSEQTSSLTTLHNLAICYQRQGRVEKAEKLFSLVLEHREQRLGPQHTTTVNTANLLASLRASHQPAQMT